MRIFFSTNNLSFGSTEIPVYNCAFHNQALLQNESIIFFKSKLPSEPTVVNKFEKHYKLFAYQDNQHLERIANQGKLDPLYFIKSGEHDGDLVSSFPCAQYERIIFLPRNSDINYKIRFINTADGMIKMRDFGKSFGLACGEFLIKNKPMMTYALSPQRSHIEILGNKTILYKGKLN